MKTQTLPSISVVTISYNQGKYLEETILSILNQEYKNFEYILIDGGSTDNSRSIIKSYEKHLKYWISERDDGPPHALNKGLEMCNGDFFYYLNSDDRLLPDSFRKFSGFYSKYPSYDVYYGHGSFIDKDSKVLSNIYSFKWIPSAYISGFSLIVQQSSFCRLDMVRKAGGFNRQNLTCWDGELFMDLDHLGAKFIRMPYKIGLFRIHDNSITGSGRLHTEYIKDRERINYKYKALRKFGMIQKIIYCLSDPFIFILRSFLKIKNKAVSGKKFNP